MPPYNELKCSHFQSKQCIEQLSEVDFRVGVSIDDRIHVRLHIRISLFQFRRSDSQEPACNTTRPQSHNRRTLRSRIKYFSPSLYSQPMLCPSRTFCGRRTTDWTGLFLLSKSPVTILYIDLNSSCDCQVHGLMWAHMSPPWTHSESTVDSRWVHCGLMCVHVDSRESTGFPFLSNYLSVEIVPHLIRPF